MARLDELCTLNMGQSPDSASYNFASVGLPFFQGNADFGALHPVIRVWCDAPTKIAHPGDILISVRAPIGALNIADRDCCIGRGLAALTVNERLCDKGFIWYALANKVGELNSKGTGSTFKAISKNILGETEISAPPLQEQKRIAAVLDKLCGLISLRKQQLTHLEDLVKARFVEMFGDLKLNDKNWPVFSFNSFAKIDTTMVHDFTEYGDCPHIGIDSIEKNTGILSGYRTVREDRVISGKYLFTPEHVIYSKIRPNLNKVALPDFGGVCSADAYPILPKKGKSNRVFLAYALRSPVFLDYILAFSSRTNLPKVNKQQVEGFHCPLPDLGIQDQFASFFDKAARQKRTVQQSLAQLETLKKSLMQDYFG